MSDVSSNDMMDWVIIGVALSFVLVAGIAYLSQEIRIMLANLRYRRRARQVRLARRWNRTRS